jgi:hypothetical protein
MGKQVRAAELIGRNCHGALATAHSSYDWPPVIPKGFTISYRVTTYDKRRIGLANIYRELSRAYCARDRVNMRVNLIMDNKTGRQVAPSNCGLGPGLGHCCDALRVSERNSIPRPTCHSRLLLTPTRLPLSSALVCHCSYTKCTLLMRSSFKVS